MENVINWSDPLLSLSLIILMVGIPFTAILLKNTDAIIGVVFLSAMTALLSLIVQEGEDADKLDKAGKRYEYVLLPSENKGHCDVRMNIIVERINRTFDDLWNEKNKRVITMPKPCSDIVDSDTEEMQRLYQEKLGTPFYPDKEGVEGTQQNETSNINNELIFLEKETHVVMEWQDGKMKIVEIVPPPPNEK